MPIEECWAVSMTILSDCDAVKIVRKVDVGLACIYVNHICMNERVGCMYVYVVLFFSPSVKSRLFDPTG